MEKCPPDKDEKSRLSYTREECSANLLEEF